MLKISFFESRSTRRLVVEGMLIAPWVSELEKACKTAKVDLQNRKLDIDLTNVTRISREGEAAISELMREGARFSCRGVLTKHTLQQLARKNKNCTSVSICASSR